MRVTAFALATLAFFAALAVPVSTDDPVSSSVRFNREIIRILQRRCLACHNNDGLVMPLTAYGDVRSWGRAIREELVEQRMPPTPAAPGYGRFANQLALMPREMTTLLTWLDGGMPRGDDRDLPASLEPPGAAPAGVPDVRLELPEQRIPALEDLVIRKVSVDTGFDAARAVARVVLRPGSRDVLRGALLYGDSTWIGGWLPWNQAIVPPVSGAFRLSKAAKLTVALYYRGADEAVTDKSVVEVFFAPPAAARRPLEDLVMPSGQYTLASDTTIWALQPSFDAGTRSVELRARRPDGSIDVLLWMPVARHEWPHALVLQDPVKLPAKTVLTFSAGESAARMTMGVLRP